MYSSVIDIIRYCWWLFKAGWSNRKIYFSPSALSALTHSIVVKHYRI